MLTQDDFVAPKMSAEMHLQRSSWKAEAIRRGDLKISGPFPITEETRLSDDDERERAEKINGEPLPLLPDVSSPSTQSLPPQTQPSTRSENANIVSDKVDAPQEAEENNHGVEHKASSSDRQETSGIQTQSSPQLAPYNSPSPFPSTLASSTQTASKKKRKGSLRNVFRKMFGRKSRETTQLSEVVESKHGHHRSEPITLHESPKVTRENVVAARISDLPVRELQPINPLAQHLPFPMNVNAPQEMSPPHDYLTFEVPPRNLSRRATLPNIHLPNTEKGVLTPEMGGSIPSPQIGIALSSPPPTAQYVQSKRRSRSAGALRELAKGRPSIERRRSAEIRYWRNSYQSGSVYSTATPRPQTARTVETAQSMDVAQDTNVNAALEPTSGSRTDADTPAVPEHSLDIDQNPLPLEQPFNFGNLKIGFSDELSGDGAVEIPPRSEKRRSIEERVKHLEDNMRTLETSVRRISGRSNRQTIILETPPKGRRLSRTRSSSATCDLQGSQDSDGGSSHNVAISVEQKTPGPPSPKTLTTASQPFGGDIDLSANDRRQTVIALQPSVNAITRHSAPTAPQASDLDIAEQLSRLNSALQHERSARLALENHVDMLQQEVVDLHALVNKFLSQSPSYPTPSPDAIITTNEERISTPRAASHHPGGRGHSLVGPDDEGGGTPGTLKKLRRTRETIISRFSYDSDKGDADVETSEYSVDSSRDDITSPESWATPKEERGFGSGFFSEIRKEDDMF